MIPRRRWFDRRFTLRVPIDEFPELLERVRGTPPRLEEAVRPLPRDVLVRRVDDQWSIQEHVGHLLDLESLWMSRLETLLAGGSDLRAADVQNRATHEARHNERPLDDLLGRFRAARGALVARLDGLDADVLAAEALHPRLREPINVVGVCLFAAEHDDHHLAAIRPLIRAT